MLLCIQTGKTMSDTHRMKFATDQFYFKTAEEMAKVFGELPDALSRTVDIAARCNVKIDRIPNALPEFKVPEGHTPGSYFEQRGPRRIRATCAASRERWRSKARCAIHWRNTRAACLSRSK